MLARLERVQYVEHHTVALAGQETGFFVDIPVVGVGIARDGLTATTAEFRRAYIQLGSTMEHSVIEQNYPGMSAVSTVRYVRENNLAGGKTFYATSANYLRPSPIRHSLRMER
ncbi:MAG: hypothetical protein IPL39_02475 [Opitutaceae bacterium]|nr:hypothetical protein [Opitutaceae bacterium]